MFMPEISQDPEEFILTEVPPRKVILIYILL